MKNMFVSVVQVAVAYLAFHGAFLLGKHFRTSTTHSSNESNMTMPIHPTAELDQRKPSTGRIVHYVQITGFHAPAIVTSCYANCVASMNVFNDPTFDVDNQNQPLPPVVQKTAVPWDQVNKRRGTWHWPEL